MLGEEDFFSQEEAQYLYDDGGSLRPCPGNCKRCTTNNDCQECGDYNNPSKIVYKVHSTVKDCSNSCEASDFDFVLPGTTYLTCLKCPDNNHYLEGSDPPSCSPCNSGAFWVHTPSGFCKPCASGCGRVLQMWFVPSV